MQSDKILNVNLQQNNGEKNEFFERYFFVYEFIFSYPNQNLKSLLSNATVLFNDLMPERQLTSVKIIRR